MLMESKKETKAFFQKYDQGYVKNPIKKLFGICNRKNKNYFIYTTNKEKYTYSSIEELIFDGWIID